MPSRKRPLLLILLLASAGAEAALPHASPPCAARVEGRSTVYGNVQDAIDAAVSGDTVLVAGTCSEWFETPAPSLYVDPPASGLLPQLALIDKDLTLRGGYSSSDWTTSDPVAHPTVLDAGDAARGILVFGPATVTIENLTVQEGNSSDLAGYGWDWDMGANIAIIGATATLTDVTVRDGYAGPDTSMGAGIGISLSTVTLQDVNVIGNIGYWGAGLAVDGSSVTIEGGEYRYNEALEGAGLALYNATGEISGIVVQDNYASAWGAGLAVESAVTTVTDSLITSNAGDGVLTMHFSEPTVLDMSGCEISDNSGSGFDLQGGVVNLQDNDIMGNVASSGGGLYVYNTTLQLSRNRILSNESTLTAASAFTPAGGGGGIILSSQSVFDGNVIAYNTARNEGGGLYFGWQGDTDIVNNFIAWNTADLDGDSMGHGGGLHIGGVNANLVHNTLAGNDGVAVYCHSFSPYPPEYDLCALCMENNIIVDSTTGLTVTTDNEAWLDTNLFWEVSTRTVASGSLSETGSFEADPALVSPADLDLHLGSSSAALGVALTPSSCLSIGADYDGETRDAAPDIGADELVDSDSDGIMDRLDLCPGVADPDQEDTDGDAWGDACDCDSEDPGVNPDAVERCNGIDDDCDGEIDEGTSGTSVWYSDADRDGYGDPASGISTCTPTEDQVEDGSDCDDTDPSVHPAAAELCDGADQDCDGEIDEGAPGEALYHTDADHDGFGDPATGVTTCSPAEDEVTDATDCDDTDPTIHPAATETCDGVDQDCDEEIDEAGATGESAWYADTDEDSYGDPATPATACVAPTGHVADNSDCDDTDPSVHPGATETCDGTDQDCDDEVDEAGATGESTWYADTDEDSYGDPKASATACAPPTGHVADNSDCNDTDAAVHPSAKEIWYDGVDQNCDGNDQDQDGDGHPAGEDCDDEDPTRYKGCEDTDSPVDDTNSPDDDTEVPDDDTDLPDQDTGTDKSKGCGCAASNSVGGQSLGTLGALLGIALLSSRRRRKGL